MQRLMLCAVACVLAGCANDDCEQLHQVVMPNTGTAPGTLRAGVAFQINVAVDVAPRGDGGVMCLTCRGLVMFDPELREVGRRDDELPSFAVALDGALYAIARGADDASAKLVALSPSGELRWTAPIAAQTNQIKLVVGASGPYVGVLLPAGGGSALNVDTVLGFAVDTGAMHTVATGQQLLGAGRTGVITLEGRGTTAATLHELGPDGSPVWSRPITTQFLDVLLDEAVATPDGGVIAFGTTHSEIDFGDFTLGAVPGGKGFVAAFDATGATLWAFAQSTMDLNHVALTTRGELVLAGVIGGGIAGPEADGILAVATPDGIVRTTLIDGPGDQTIFGLAPAPDGAVWIELYSVMSDDFRSPPIMHIGDRTFTDDAAYLFEIVP